MTVAASFIENRSSRRLTLSLADAEGHPIGTRVFIQARRRVQFPSYPLLIGAVYNLTGRYSGCSRRGDFNFAMAEGCVIAVTFTTEGPIYNRIA